MTKDAKDFEDKVAAAARTIETSMKVILRQIDPAAAIFALVEFAAALAVKLKLPHDAFVQLAHDKWLAQVELQHKRDRKILH